MSGGRDLLEHSGFINSRLRVGIAAISDYKKILQMNGQVFEHYSMKHDVHLQPATSMKSAGVRG